MPLTPVEIGVRSRTDPLPVCSSFSSRPGDTGQWRPAGVPPRPEIRWSQSCEEAARGLPQAAATTEAKSTRIRTRCSLVRMAQYRRVKRAPAPQDSKCQVMGGEWGTPLAGKRRSYSASAFVACHG